MVVLFLLKKITESPMDIKRPLFFDRKTSEHAKKILEESQRLSFPEFFNRLLKRKYHYIKGFKCTGRLPT